MARGPDEEKRRRSDNWDGPRMSDRDWDRMMDSLERDRSCMPPRWAERPTKQDDDE